MSAKLRYFQLYLQTRWQLVVVFVSMLLAIWIITQEHGAINSDGILYVDTARLIFNGQWQAAFARYNWPFYSVLIAVVKSLTGLGFQDSGHFLAVIFFGGTIYGLITLIKEVGGGFEESISGVFLLFSSNYLLGDVVPMVVRDHGFWAGFIWSLVFFIRFYRKKNIRDAAAWLLISSIMTLFRIEGALYLILLPFSIFFNKDFHKPQQTLQYLKIALLEGIVLLAAWAILGFVVDTYGFSRVGELISRPLLVYSQMISGLAPKLHILSNDILGSEMNGYAYFVLIIALLITPLIKALFSAGYAQLLLAVLHAKYRRKGSRLSIPIPVAAAVIVICMLYACGMALTAFAVSTRYLSPVAFIVILYASFSLGTWVNNNKNNVCTNKFENYLYKGLIAIVTLQFIAIIFPKPLSAFPEKLAAEWLVENVSENKNIYYSSRRIKYYKDGDSADRTMDNWDVVKDTLQSKKLCKLDFVVVGASGEDQVRKEFINSLFDTKPTKSFKSKHKTVYIYEVSATYKNKVCQG